MQQFPLKTIQDSISKTGNNEDDALPAVKRFRIDDVAFFFARSNKL